METRNRPSPLFGVSLTPTARNSEQLLKLAQVADAAELEILAVQDHPYNATFLDTWTLLSVIGGQTNRIKLLPDVGDLPLRPPAMLAKAASSLDLLTGGRVELGLGAGAFWDAIEAYGGPRRTPGEAVDALREGIEIMRLLWETPPNQAINYAGKHYTLAGAQAGPQPAHAIGIWLGVAGPRTLRLTGELADGWVAPLGVYVSPERARESGKMIDDAALAVGRDPLAIRRAYNVPGAVLRPDQTNMRANRPGVVVGPTQLWADTLTTFYREIGMDTFIFWPSGGDEERQIRLFAEEVVPAARAAIGSATS